MSIIEDKHKADAGKAPISLVPTAIIWDMAEVRDYGLKKYPETGRDGWKNLSEKKDPGFFFSDMRLPCWKIRTAQTKKVAFRIEVLRPASYHSFARRLVISHEIFSVRRMLRARSMP